MDTVEMPLPMPEKSKGERMWARVLSCYSATSSSDVTVYDTPCRVDMGNVGGYRSWKV